jgi:hypothetical protein
MSYAAVTWEKGDHVSVMRQLSIAAVHGYVFGSGVEIAQ